jgi:chromosome segregation ATPase
VEGYKIAIDTLKSQVESERQRASRAESEVDFLRTTLSKTQDEVQKLLTHQRDPEKQIRPWWRIW